MSEHDNCGLCGLPVLRGAYSAEGVLLHHGGELTAIVGEEHGFDGCRPILTSCRNAWEHYGQRPYQDDEVETA